MTCLSGGGSPESSESSRARFVIAIHAAIVASNGNEFYTGEPLEWERISTYCNESRKAVVPQWEFSVLFGGRR